MTARRSRASSITAGLLVVALAACTTSAADPPAVPPLPIEQFRLDTLRLQADAGEFEVLSTTMARHHQSLYLHSAGARIRVTMHAPGVAAFDRRDDHTRVGFEPVWRPAEARALPETGSQASWVPGTCDRECVALRWPWAPDAWATVEVEALRRAEDDPVPTADLEALATSVRAAVRTDAAVEVRVPLWVDALPDLDLTQLAFNGTVPDRIVSATLMFAPTVLVSEPVRGVPPPDCVWIELTRAMRPSETNTTIGGRPAQVQARADLVAQGIAILIPNRTEDWTLVVLGAEGAFADVAAAEAYAETVTVVDDPGRLADWYPMHG